MSKYIKKEQGRWISPGLSCVLPEFSTIDILPVALGLDNDAQAGSLRYLLRSCVLPEFSTIGILPVALGLDNDAQAGSLRYLLRSCVLPEFSTIGILPVDLSRS